MKKINEILNFWFEDIDDSTVLDSQHPTYRKWFVKSEETDKLITDNFKEDLQTAGRGDYDQWQQDSKGSLALIILLDQFSRNIYRNTPRSFDHDEKALKLCLKVIEEEMDQEMTSIERQFVYLPLMHSEELDVQEESLKYFGELLERAKERQFNEKYFKNTFDYAQRHISVIKQFGRFPHRNKVLGRTSLYGELEFLKRPGSSF